MSSRSEQFKAIQTLIIKTLSELTLVELIHNSIHNSDDDFYIHEDDSILVGDKVSLADQGYCSVTNIAKSLYCVTRHGIRTRVMYVEVSKS